MVRFVILPMVLLVANGAIDIDANGFANGTTGRTLNNIGIPFIPLVDP